MRQVFDFEGKGYEGSPSNPAAAAARAERDFIRAAAEVRYTDATIRQVSDAYERARQEGALFYNPARGMCAAWLAGATTMVMPFGEEIELRQRSRLQQERLALRVERRADALMRAVARRAKQDPEWAREKRELLKADNGALLADLKRLASATDAGQQAISDMLGALTRAAKKAQPQSPRAA